MVTRMVKIIFGVGLPLSFAREYKRMVDQVGGDIFSLSFICLIGAFCLLMAYSGYKDVPMRSFLKKNVVVTSIILMVALIAGAAFYSAGVS